MYLKRDRTLSEEPVQSKGGFVQILRNLLESHEKGLAKIVSEGEEFIRPARGNLVFPKKLIRLPFFSYQLNDTMEGCWETTNSW